MSDFWEKNKGSITSGLKTAGKYGYQGSKYVAKTGYQAGKKNFNNKKKTEPGNKDQKDEEDEEMDDRSHGRGYGGRYRDPAPYQPYQQQPPYQQPQYQQPPYQQPQYQQPPYQQPQYQQPQYQQPQYQQPQYQQPQYQQTPYQQPQYQQPQYQQPQLQQPQLQQPQYPQQQTPGQYQPQPPPQYGQSPAPAVAPQQSATPPQPPQRAPVANLPPQTPQQGGPAVGQPPTVQAQSVALPGMTASPGAPIQMLSPTPLQPSEMQPYGVNPSSGDLSGAASSQPSMLSFEHIAQAPAPVQGTAPPGYGRARLASPPLSTREAFPLPVSAASTGGNSGSVPGVNPYDPDAPKEVRRLPTSAVDVTALPPPPKHRDRGSALNLPAQATAPTKVSGQAETRAEARVAPRAVTSELDPTTLNQVAPTPLPATSVPQAALASPIELSTEETSEPIEESKLGIAGKFDYDVKVGYAPPPKPHRNSSKAASTSLAHKAAAPLPKRSSTDSLHSKAPPALPGRHLSSDTARSSAPGDAANPSFQPPPKPFRRSESSPAGHSTSASAAEKVSTGTMPAPVDLSSFPPPPVQRRQSHRSTTSRAESIPEDTDEPRRPTPRGRIPVDVQQVENGESETEEPLHRKKEAPPVVKPKPISLSGHNSEHSNASEISAISNELATFKLRKTGSGYLGDESRVSNAQSKRSPPPAVPQKKESLKHAPPVPLKSSSLKIAEGHNGRQGKNNELNPFEHYLKSAVPAENDRLHR